jgi:CRP-like cAMP-binding protein
MAREPDLRVLRSALQLYGGPFDWPDWGSAVRTVRQVESEIISWDDPDVDQAVHVLLDGAAYRFVHLIGGRRHIDDVFGPGSICNADRIYDPDHRVNLAFKRGSLVAMADPGAMAALLDSAPRLADAIEHQEAARARRLWQRVRTLISLPAPHRVTTFLLDLVDEFRIADPAREWVPYVLTQEEIADTLGLTEVHVNRVLARMEGVNEIERKRGAFRLPNAARLRRQLHYRPTFPTAGQESTP